MNKIKNKRLMTSYMSIVIIMSIVLFLFGFFGLFFISSNSIINSFKESFSVSMFLKENVKNVEIIQLKNELLISEYIENLNFISKENAVMIMKEEYGEDFIKDLGYNPLVDSIDINLKSEYVESTKLDSISNILSRNKYIDEIVYDKNLINLINKNIKKISFWLLPSIGVFLLFTFLIILLSIPKVGVTSPECLSNTRRLGKPHCMV